jgi:hypothetical protein
MCASVAASGSRRAVAIVGAAIGPSILFVAYLIASRSLIGAYNARLDWIGVGVAVALGLWFFWRLPLQRPWRVPVLIAFAGSTAVWLMLLGLGFVCSIYGDCL